MGEDNNPPLRAGDCEGFPSSTAVQSAHTNPTSPLGTIAPAPRELRLLYQTSEQKQLLPQAVLHQVVCKFIEISDFSPAPDAGKLGVSKIEI